MNKTSPLAIKCIRKDIPTESLLEANVVQITKF